MVGEKTTKAERSKRGDDSTSRDKLLLEDDYQYCNRNMPLLKKLQKFQ